MKYKNIYQGMLVIIMLIMALVAVAIFLDIRGDSGSETTSQERTVTMLVRESNDTLGLERMIKKLYVDEKIRVDLQVVPDNQIESLVRMKVNTGESPDILEYDVPNAYGLISPELYLEELSDSSWVERLISTDSVEYTEGDIYAFPLQESAGLGGIIYNVTVFEELGLSIPTTTEEFHEICQVLIGENITPVLICADYSVNQMWVEYGNALSFGSQELCIEVVQSLETQETELGDYEEIVVVMESYLSLFESQYVNADFSSITYTELCERMGDGTGAMMVGNFNNVTNIEYINQEVELGMFPIPFDYNEDLEYITTQSCEGLVVFKDGENTELAKEVLEFWSQPEYLELWYMDFAGIPAVEDVESTTMNEGVLDLYEYNIVNGQEIHGFTNYSLSLYNLVTSNFWLYYMEGAIHGESALDILEKCQDDINNYLN